MKTMLVTGASGGIGQEIARIHAANGGNLIVVARSKQKLDDLKSELEKAYGVSVKVISADLSLPEAGKELFEKVKDVEVEYLVNNAGFGGLGDFAKRDWAADLNMINLNVVALAELTRLFLPQMLARGSGRVLNLASIAAFMAGPKQAVYHASKAFVLSLSRALSQELAGSGVSVTALCPGPVKTGFAKAADLDKSRIFANASVPVQTVAKAGYKAMLKGKTQLIPGLSNKISIFMLRFLPFSVVDKVTHAMYQKA